MKGKLALNKPSFLSVPRYVPNIYQGKSKMLLGTLGMSSFMLCKSYGLVDFYNKQVPIKENELLR